MIRGQATKRKGFSFRERFTVLKRDGFRCVYCGTSALRTELEFDHRIAFSAGGKDSANNLVTSCSACNQGKGRRSVKPWPKCEDCGTGAGGLEICEATASSKRFAREEYFRKLHAGCNGPKSLSVSEICGAPTDEPWHWRCAKCSRGGYRIDAERLVSPSHVLAWTFHLAGKGWFVMHAWKSAITAVWLDPENHA